MGIKPMVLAISGPQDDAWVHSRFPYKNKQAMWLLLRQESFRHLAEVKLERLAEGKEQHLHEWHWALNFTEPS